MSYHFQNHPFWGLLVISPDRDIVTNPISYAPFRPGLVARWERGLDGRLERRWHKQSISTD
jgi:hypothetical protein